MGKPVFETQPCGRCGGSGRHSYNPRDGDTCWGCNGKGWQYTKRGAAAVAHFRAAFMLPIKDVQPGQKLYDDFRHRFVEVASNDPDNGVLRYTDGSSHVYDGYPDHEVRRKSDNEDERQAQLQAALAYQDTLTKAGTPRKR